ncbi:MAG: 2-oxoglutarate dehydrogenase E2 component (dihydrolipoamide succinyltransferase) [Chitinophagales bacterium]|jgi:2-oxoglutarate dehydrogenase E2 component (dihydrolipoamide succinyltransferase)
MPTVELLMPKLGESIIEATILTWNKQVGDTVEVDEAVLEIATDKVDSEVPSEVAGKITKLLFEEGDVVPVGSAVALIETEGGESAVETPSAAAPVQSTIQKVEETVEVAQAQVQTESINSSEGSRFYSPLVMSMAKEEGIAMQELESIPGTGKEGRVTKSDMQGYLQNRGQANIPVQEATAPIQTPKTVKVEQTAAPSVAYTGNVEVVQMDRMRKMIAKHMINSVQTSPHVTTFVEADVTNLVKWRNKVKAEFQKREGEKITFTPIFIEAVAKALKEFPYVNCSLDGENIILKKDINIGMAAALPSGNLIVPVIKNCDQLNLVGITKKVNDLANRARQNKLKPDETTGGTYTLTNVGSFGNVMGTPIINQPQVGILAVGSIQKKPVVLETEDGDVIAIRHMMFLSHSYDHRIVDGAMGGRFVKRVAELLEGFDANRTL